MRDDLVIVIIFKPVQRTYGAALLLLVFLFVLPAILSVWVFTHRGFGEATLFSLQSASAWFWCGIFWGVLLGALRSLVGGVLSGVVAAIAGVVWICTPSQPTDRFLVVAVPTHKELHGAASPSHVQWSADGQRVYVGSMTFSPPNFIFDTTTWKQESGETTQSFVGAGSRGSGWRLSLDEKYCWKRLHKHSDGFSGFVVATPSDLSEVRRFPEIRDSTDDGSSVDSVLGIAGERLYRLLFFNGWNYFGIWDIQTGKEISRKKSERQPSKLYEGIWRKTVLGSVALFPSGKISFLDQARPDGPFDQLFFMDDCDGLGLRRVYSGCSSYKVLNQGAVLVQQQDQLLIIDQAAGKAIRAYKCPRYPTGYEVSRDEKRLLIWDGREARLLDVDTGDCLLTVTPTRFKPQGMDEEVAFKSAALSPDGRMVIGLQDSGFRVWRLP